jgi:DNA-directed RNA polymerase subunit RPC12/RpoP
MTVMRCPRCGSYKTVALRRHGVRQFLARLVFFRPFECEQCRARFLGYVSLVNR